TFTPSDMGVHTFTGVTLQRNGPRTITVKDTENDPLITGSATVQVLGPHYSISAPATTVAGQPFSMTVTAQKFDNTTNTGYLGTISFTTTDPGTGKVLPGNYTFLPADMGVHTFTGVVLVTAGPQTITGTDFNNSSISGISNTILVNAAGANK